MKNKHLFDGIGCNIKGLDIAYVVSENRASFGTIALGEYAMGEILNPLPYAKIDNALRLKYLAYRVNQLRNTLMASRQVYANVGYCWLMEDNPHIVLKCNLVTYSHHSQATEANARWAVPVITRVNGNRITVKYVSYLAEHLLLSWNSGKALRDNDISPVWSTEEVTIVL